MLTADGRVDIEDLLLLLAAFGSSGAGDIDSSELAGVAKELGVEMSESEVKATMAQIDADGGGDGCCEEQLALHAVAVSADGLLEGQAPLGGAGVGALCTWHGSLVHPGPSL